MALLNKDLGRSQLAMVMVYWSMVHLVWNYVYMSCRKESWQAKTFRFDFTGWSMKRWEETKIKQTRFIRVKCRQNRSDDDHDDKLTKVWICSTDTSEITVSPANRPDAGMLVVAAVLATFSSSAQAFAFALGRQNLLTDGKLCVIKTWEVTKFPPMYYLLSGGRKVWLLDSAEDSPSVWHVSSPHVSS